VNYIGSVGNRFYAIKEIFLEEILLVSQIKYKLNCKLLYNQEDCNSSKKKKALNSREQDLFFAGFLPRGGKKNLDDEVNFKKYFELANQVMEYCLDAFQMEKQSILPIMNLRECIKNLHNEGNTAIEFRTACDEIEFYLSLIRLKKSHHCINLEKHYAYVEKMQTLKQKIDLLKHSLSNQSLALFPDFLQRKKLLKTLGYIDQNETVCIKGRVACEVNTCEELILTEMIFEGTLNELHFTEIVAALSALVFQEKTSEGCNNSFENNDNSLPETLEICCDSMRTIALNLGYLQKEAGLPLDPYDYCESCLKFGLVHVVFLWARGMAFKDICEFTSSSVQEGTIVRCITRLDELCRDVRNCARLVGNPTLYRKMEDASVSIKRDIVFATSLYVS